jgi:hypothetical protein
MNQGYNPDEITELKQEMLEAGMNFLYIDDEDEDDLFETGEFAHFTFVGKYNEKEVIYDACMYSLRMYHSGLLLEEAEERVKKSNPNFVEHDKRNGTYQGSEDLDLMVLETIEELEEEETIKVSETLEIDANTEYGVGLDVILNVEEIDDEVISKFVSEYNAGTFSLDKTLYSFKNEEE